MYYPDPYVSALAIGDSTIYVGGHFIGIGGEVRGGLAEIELDSGQVTAWNPDPGPWTGEWNRDVAALAVSGSGVLVAGYFETLGGQARRFVGEVDRVSGLATGWNPNANDPVLVLTASEESMYLGGTFTGLGPLWQRRHDLAAFDATTGAVKEWKPNPDGLIVATLAFAHDKVYAGGYFFNIGGQERWGLAALDTLTGAATDWNPTANSEVATLEVVGDRLYAGGYFTTIGGIPRNHLASFDLATGNLTAWDPNASGDVYDLALNGNTVYLAGFFLSVGGQPRKYVAAVDATTGALGEWNPNPDVTVYTVAAAESVVYVGGRFRNVGGQARRGLAALDTETGAVTPWTANVDAEVFSLALMGDTIFVGGGFSSISGKPRTALAALERSTGSVLDWAPNPAGGIGTLSVDGSNLYVGGYFKSADDNPCANLLAISFGPPAPDPDPIPLSVALARIAPNPVRGSTRARFALPTTSRVTLSVFDIQGRQISSLLHDAEFPAGTHEVPLRAEGWAEGFYFLRLEANRTVMTRKFVVLR